VYPFRPVRSRNFPAPRLEGAYLFTFPVVLLALSPLPVRHRFFFSDALPTGRQCPPPPSIRSTHWPCLRRDPLCFSRSSPPSFSGLRWTKWGTSFFYPLVDSFFHSRISSIFFQPSPTLCFLAGVLFLVSGPELAPSCHHLPVRRFFRYSFFVPFRPAFPRQIFRFRSVVHLPLNRSTDCGLLLDTGSAHLTC